MPEVVASPYSSSRTVSNGEPRDCHWLLWLRPSSRPSLQGSYQSRYVSFFALSLPVAFLWLQCSIGVWLSSPPVVPFPLLLPSSLDLSSASISFDTPWRIFPLHRQPQAPSISSSAQPLLIEPHSLSLSPRVPTTHGLQSSTHRTLHTTAHCAVTRV